MNDMQRLVADSLDRMHRGDRENAFFTLVGADASALPLLMEAFDQPENREIRADIVECIWQHRDPQSIEFLSRALDDPDPNVWKQALDGLVTIGSQDAIRAIEVTRQRIAESTRQGGVAMEWIDEALDQVRRTD